MKTMKLESRPHCPSCKTVVDGATNISTSDAPKAGDVSVCCYCQALLCVEGAGDVLALREMSTEEFVELPVETRSLLKRLQEHFHAANLQPPQPKGN